MSSDTSENERYQDQTLVLTEADHKQMLENDKETTFSFVEEGIRYTVTAEEIDDE